MSETASQQQEEEEDKKPNKGGVPINLKVKGGEVIFRIKRSTQLKKLMNAYCDRHSVEINSISFLFDGRHLRGEQTPDELEMEDGDEIVAMLHQSCSGGCREKERKEEREMSGAASQLQEEDKKPNEGGVPIINLKVKSQGGNDVIFRIKRSTKLKKLMNPYCDRQSVEINSIAFLFDGLRLREEQTPDELEMKDGDEIVAMLHQRCSGGCRESERKEEREMSGAESQQQEEDKKPNEGGTHINLKVKGQGGNEVFFRIKRSTKLKKLMNAYCDRQSVEINSIGFLFDGLLLRGEQTPDELEMKDGDEIVAMLHQRCSGGCRESERKEEREMSGAASQQQEEDKKPNEGGAHINLKVKGQGGNEVFFRIKRSTKLKKLMNAYCDRQSVEINSIAFLFDGRRLRGEQTPDEFEMEDGDEIVAMLHQ